MQQRRQAGRQEGDTVAPERQTIFKVERKIFYPDKGLLSLLQEGLLKTL